MSNVYHANFKTTDPRPGRQSKTWTFGAADDGTAAAIAAELGNWNAGQLTSLTKRVSGPGSTYAGLQLGTQGSVFVIVSDASFNVWRASFRNAYNFGAGNLVAAVNAAFMGTGYADAQFVITGLADPPILPNSGNPVAVVNSIKIVNKYA